MMSPAITSSLDGKIYLSGSLVGKTKAVISVDTKGEMSQSSIQKLPELNFGRNSHSMSIINQRYLYVIGGKFQY